MLELQNNITIFPTRYVWVLNEVYIIYVLCYRTSEQWLFELISKYWNESLDGDVQIDLLNSFYISLILTSTVDEQ
jgi:hypothetical protein